MKDSLKKKMISGNKFNVNGSRKIRITQRDTLYANCLVCLTTRAFRWMNTHAPDT